MTGVKVFIAVQVAALLGFGATVIWGWQQFTVMRERDCQATVDARALNTENDVALWRDVQDILGNDPDDEALFDDLIGRIRHRNEALPPPPACQP